MGLESENVDTMWHRDRQLVRIVVVIKAVFPLCFIFRSILKLEWSGKGLGGDLARE
jgi:hypothetical protein